MARKPKAAVVVLVILLAAPSLVSRGWAEGKRLPAEPPVKTAPPREAVEAGPVKQAPARAAAPAHQGKRLREGSKVLDATGRFEVTGDRLSFVSAEPAESLWALENLALERVNQVLKDSRSSPTWVVSGVVTEYNGGNYLLLTKAVQAGKPAADK